MVRAHACMQRFLNQSEFYEEWGRASMQVARWQLREGAAGWVAAL
jgi:hypothetical protein